MEPVRISRLWITPLLLGAFLNACGSSETEDSDAVNQKRIYQIYSLWYRERIPELEIQAQFRFGDRNGTTLELVGDSRVTSGGQSLAVLNNKIDGTFYRRKVGTFSEDHSFEFVDADGRTFSNAVKILPLRLTSTIPAQIPKEEDLRITFEPALVTGEFVEIEISQPDTEDDADDDPVITKASSGGVGITEAVMAASKLAELVPGTEAELKITRSHYNQALDEGAEAGGHKVSLYWLTPRTISVTEAASP